MRVLPMRSSLLNPAALLDLGLPPRPNDPHEGLAALTGLPVVPLDTAFGEHGADVEERKPHLRSEAVGDVDTVEPRIVSDRQPAAGAEDLGQRLVAVRHGARGIEAGHFAVLEFAGGDAVVDVAKLAQAVVDRHHAGRERAHRLRITQQPAGEIDVVHRARQRRGCRRVIGDRRRRVGVGLDRRDRLGPAGDEGPAQEAQSHDAQHPGDHLRVEVRDETGTVVGYFKQKLFSIGGKFDVLDAQENLVCTLRGKWTSWDFRFMQGEQELASVSKKWAGVGRELFTSADNYMLTIQDTVPRDSAVRVLILAAVMCIDMVLKE